MPPPSVTGQADSASAWFATVPGQRLLESEWPSIRDAFGERPGQSWLWLSPCVATDEDAAMQGRGLRLQPVPGGWRGDVRCSGVLPLANESLATVVVQHASRGGAAASALMAECARVLVPGGRLWVFALNPLSPYRWHWKGNGLQSSEPMPWRRRLRAAGLQPDAVSRGLGPRWRVDVTDEQHALPQHGPGLRAAWALRAEKRAIPLTGLRARKPMRIGAGVPAA